MIPLSDLILSNYRLLRRTVFKRYVVCFLSWLILLYQKYLSHHTCLYTPTCSQYMLESLNRHGVVIGIILGAWRILRCHPFAKGGYDPVPENFLWYKWVL